MGKIRAAHLPSAPPLTPLPLIVVLSAAKDWWGGSDRGRGSDIWQRWISWAIFALSIAGFTSSLWLYIGAILVVFHTTGIPNHTEASELFLTNLPPIFTTAALFYLCLLPREMRQ